MLGEGGGGVDDDGLVLVDDGKGCGESLEAWVSAGGLAVGTGAEGLGESAVLGGAEDEGGGHLPALGVVSDR